MADVIASPWSIGILVVESVVAKVGGKCIGAPEMWI